MHFSEKTRIDIENNSQMAGQQASQHLDRPRLKRLDHQGVVGVRKNACAQRPRLIPGQPVFVEQQPHELRHSQRGMGVV